LKTTRAVNHDRFWHGGPDFVIEIVSPRDQTREKLGFYGAVGTRELLVVDRDPWQLELYRLDGKELALVATSRLPDESWLSCGVVGLRMRLRAGSDRPRISVCGAASARTWQI
jgi:Uma2 family endonuclease